MKIRTKRALTLLLVPLLAPFLTTEVASADPGDQLDPVLSPAVVDTFTTPFSFMFENAADNPHCDGTGAQNWRAHAFIVGGDVDITTLQFGPTPSGWAGIDFDGSDGTMAAPLFVQSDPRVAMLPANTPAGLIDPAQLQGFNFNPSFGWVFVDGEYQIGFICEDGTGFAQQWWILDVIIDADASDGPFMQLASEPEPAPVADFDGDGDTDIAVFRPSDGRWYVNGTPGSVPFGAEGDVPVPGNYDEDPETDFAVFRPSVGKWYVDGAGASVPFGTGGDIPVPGNYDEDPETDMAVFRPSTGRWYVHGAAGSTQWGTNGDIPVPGDYDGDGVTEFAVFRPSVGKWYVEGAGGSVPFGTAGDIPVAADYDGDGSTDMAVFRPSTGRWFIEGTEGSTQWGTAGDIPVAADYDGDGAADIAVFRPSTGRWYLLSAGVTVPWGTAGDIPASRPVGAS